MGVGVDSEERPGSARGLEVIFSAIGKDAGGVEKG